jgi:uncharacterized membrane protein
MDLKKITLGCKSLFVQSSLTGVADILHNLALATKETLKCLKLTVILSLGIFSFVYLVQVFNFIHKNKNDAE